jgi:hypothetical protein
MARVNEHGGGSEQYPPAMMLELLIYSYATLVTLSYNLRRLHSLRAMLKAA